MGSIVSYDLDDYADITSRIKKASQAMGAITFFWDLDYVDIGAKALIYLAIPVNLLLWRCQSWALTKVITKINRSLSHEIPKTYTVNKMG